LDTTARARGEQEGPCWARTRPKAHRPPTRSTAREARSLGEQSSDSRGQYGPGVSAPRAAIPKEGIDPSASLAASGPLSRAAYNPANVTTREDIASVGEQLAELTRTVEEMAKDLKGMTERADRQQARADSQQDLVDSQQERAQTQQERIDLAARELADVSDRLQAAATALRDSF
jgi:hypothetical protein